MTQELKDPDAVVVKIDAALKRLYAEAIAQLDDAKTAGGAAWYKRYSTTASIVQHVPPLYLAGGFATEKEFFAAKLQETPQSVNRNMRVAHLATVAEVEKHTPTRLLLAISYVEAKTKQPIKDRGSIDFDTLKIQLKRSGKIITKLFGAFSYTDLREAVAQVSEGTTKPNKQTPAGKAITEALKASGVKEAKATVTKTKVTLRVPLEGLPAIIKALGDFKLPTE